MHNISYKLLFSKIVFLSKVSITSSLGEQFSYASEDKYRTSLEGRVFPYQNNAVFFYNPHVSLKTFL